MATGIKTAEMVIVGAGPSGLACAIAAKEAGLSHFILDKGAVADAIRRFPTNLTFFSTPELLEIGNIPFMASGFRPTRIEVVRYYQRVAYEYGLTIIYNATVSSIQKTGNTFEVVTGAGETYRTPNVIFATGYFDTPNPFNVVGADLPKVFRYYDEPFKFHGQRVAVVGGKNSAIEIALDLFRNGADVTLIHRGKTFSEGVKYWILPDIENRIKSGEIKGFFETTVREIRPESIVLEGAHEGEFPNDFVFAMIGYRPDTTLLERAGVKIDQESLAPFHDHDTMETNVKGLYVAGSIAAGKFNNRIFIENGRTHGSKIVNHIAGKD